MFKIIYPLQTWFKKRDSHHEYSPCVSWV